MKIKNIINTVLLAALPVLATVNILAGAAGTTVDMDALLEQIKAGRNTCVAEQQEVAKQKIYIEKLEKELACYKCEDSQRQNNAKPKVLDFRAPESWIINKPYAIRAVCQDLDNGLKEVTFFIRNKGDSIWEPFLADRKHSLSGTEDFVTLYHRMKKIGSYEIRANCWDADYHDEDNKVVSFEVVEAPEADVYEY